MCVNAALIQQSDWPMYQQSAILKLLNSSRVGETRHLAAKGVVCICFSRLDASASAAVYNKSVLLHCALNSRTFDQLNRSSAPHEVLRTVIWYLPLLPAPSTASDLTFNGFLPLPCEYPSCIDRLRSKTDESCGNPLSMPPRRKGKKDSSKSQTTQKSTNTSNRKTGKKVRSCPLPPKVEARR